MESSSQHSNVDYDCNALGGLFQIIINDLRNGITNWDDFLLKANKFHMQLKATIIASTAFLDSFQKIADMATTTRSGTKEIGSALTRLCLRQRSVEAKLKSMNGAMHDSFLQPLQDRVDEWKRVIVQLDKDHTKEVKRLKQFRKKHITSVNGVCNDSKNFSNFANTIRLKKNGAAGQAKQMDRLKSIGSMYDISKLLESFDAPPPGDTTTGSASVGAKEKFFMLEEVERNFVRRVLTEERSHYCLFFNFMRPMLEEEISMLQEVTHLEDVVGALGELTLDPFKLPVSSEAMLSKLQLSNSSYYSTGSLVDHNCHQTSDANNDAVYRRSRKSSISSINSINSLATDSISLQNCKSLSQPNMLPEFRPKSIASQDSGFLSTNDYNVPSFNRFKASRQFVNKSMVEQHRKSMVASMDSDYACTDELYYHRSAVLPTTTSEGDDELPIYMNLPHYGLNVSDGSVTPTNQDNADATAPYNPTINGARPYRLRSPSMPGGSTLSNRSLKPHPPPKPPLRVCSSLSSPSKAAPPPPLPKPLSTRIYVVQPDNANYNDFPPPPPEAYVDYATPTNTDSTPSSSAPVDCNYASSQLILCTDMNCLKGQHAPSSNSSTIYATTSNSQSCCASVGNAIMNIRKSYAFENAPNANGQMHRIVSHHPEEEMNQHRRFKSTTNLAN